MKIEKLDGKNYQNNKSVSDELSIDLPYPVLETTENTISVPSPLRGVWDSDLGIENHLFPDSCSARLNYIVTTNTINPSSQLKVTVQNPLETHGRYIEIFVDGTYRGYFIVWSSYLLKLGVTVTFDSSNLGGWFFSSDNTYELSIQVRCGSAGNGYKLKEVEITNSYSSINAFSNGESLYLDYQSYPYAYMKKDFAYIDDDTGDMVLSVTAHANGGYARYIYLYINDDYRGRQAFSSGGDTEYWSFSTGFSEPAKIQLIILNYGYNIWTIDSWHITNSYSWKIKIISDISLHTQYMPSPTEKTDLREALVDFSEALWDATAQQAYIDSFNIRWNYIPETCNDLENEYYYFDSTYCKGYWGNLNIWTGNEVEEGRVEINSAFAYDYGSGDGLNIYKIHIGKELPDSFGFTSSTKWQDINKLHQDEDDNMLVFVHEFMHGYFGLPDQYEIFYSVGEWFFYTCRLMAGFTKMYVEYSCDLPPPYIGYGIGNTQRGELTTRYFTGGSDSLWVSENYEEWFEDFNNDFDWLQTHGAVWLRHIASGLDTNYLPMDLKYGITITES